MVKIKTKGQKTILLLLTALLLQSEVVYSQGSSVLDNQQILLPSPTAASLGKYVDNPISFYTGTPEISVPLYELEEKDFKLPISLSYHAGGIKIEEAASNIGLGWSLIAGGIITRVVKDLPDDKKPGYCPNGFWGHWDGQGQEPDCSIGLFGGTNVHDIDFPAAIAQDANWNNWSLHNIIKKYFYVYYHNVFNGSGPAFSAEPMQSSDYPIYSKYKDTEPDLFYFNFCGKTGKFVFQVIDGIASVKTISDNDLIINHYYDNDGALNKFTIIDDNGNTYDFDIVEKSKNNIWSSDIAITPNGTFSVDGQTKLDYNSSWYLSKITTPKNNVINFYYADEEYKYFNQCPAEVNLTLVNDPETFNPQVDVPVYKMQSHTTTVQGKRLTAIKGSTTSIAFLSENRLDLYNPQNINNPKSITEVRISSQRPNDDNSTFIKGYRLIQDYFESPVENTFLIGSYDATYTTAPGVFKNDFYFKRLRLKEVQEFSNNNCVLPPVKFEYNYFDFPGYSSTAKLPHRFSFQQDLWGMYNGATANLKSMIPKLYVYPTMFNDSRRFSIYQRQNHTGPEYTILGADRLPSADMMKIGMLTKVTYPTGGSTSYEYEPHTFRDGNEDFFGGGLRIKKITKNDNTNSNNNIVYDYSYVENGQSSGRVMGLPVHGIFKYHESTIHPLLIDGSQASFRQNTIRFSQSQSVIGTTKGSNIGYRKVTEAISGNGKTVYEFSIPAYWSELNDNIAPSSNSDCSLAENGTCDGIYESTPIYGLYPGGPNPFDESYNPLTPNSYPFPENPNYDWNRGYLLSKKYYNQSGQVVRSEDYGYSVRYDNGATAPTKVYGLKFGKYWVRVNTYPAFRVAKYYYLCGVRKVLTSKTITDLQPDLGSQVSRSENYLYSGIAHSNITQISQSTSEGEELITRMKYPFDYSIGWGNGGSEGISSLVKKNIRTVPIETSIFIKRNGIEDLKTSKILSFGSGTNNIPVLKRKFIIENNVLLNNFTPSFTTGNDWILNKDSRYIEDGKVNRYNEKGDPLEIETKGGKTICYIWGYNFGQYPIAKIENATYNQIENVIPAATLQYLFDGHKFIGSLPNPVEITDNEVRNAIDIIRSSLQNAQVTTITYKPLVGITSETAPNGAILYYEYDCMNRLNFIKNKDGKITKQFNYELQN